MTEDMEEVAGTPEAEATAPDSSYSDILAGEGAAPQKTEPGVEKEEETSPEVDQAKPSEDQEVVLEIGGKSFTMKESEAVALLENASKFSEKEKALVEKEKSLNRDYTQKSQANSEFRKSIESTFGRFPEQQELQALGKVWKAYFSNPQAKQVINSILNGRPVSASTQEQGPEGALVGELRAEIDALKDQLGQFTSSFKEREEAQASETAEKTWQSWVDSKSKANIKITDEIDAAMSPFITALKAAHPDWDNNRVLDKAYEHATIDDIKKNVVGDVLKSADKAKKGNLPRITPKAPSKSDNEKTYREIILESA